MQCCLQKHAWLLRPSWVLYCVPHQDEPHGLCCWISWWWRCPWRQYFQAYRWNIHLTRKHNPEWRPTADWALLPRICTWRNPWDYGFKRIQEGQLSSCSLYLLPKQRERPHACFKKNQVKDQQHPQELVCLHHQWFDGIWRGARWYLLVGKCRHVRFLLWCG